MDFSKTILEHRQLWQAHADKANSQVAAARTLERYISDHPDLGHAISVIAESGAPITQQAGVNGINAKTEAVPPAGAERLSRWLCHKEVWASKIAYIDPGRIDGKGPGATLYVESPAGFGVSVDEVFMSKHNPQEGGYFVVYKDGYQSWSPGPQFEEGYTRI